MSWGRIEATMNSVCAGRRRFSGIRWGAAAALLLCAACVEVRVDRLFALRLTHAPGERTWAAALPLPLKSGGGAIHGTNARLAELELDTDAVHLGSASCHHGPPITSPVFAEARAFYTERELFLDVRWEDPTEDRLPRSWQRGASGWRLGELDQYGIAILWSRTVGPFGCQEACHMRDFAIRSGELVDLRAMFLVDQGDWEETWVWKPAQGAQALTLGPRGFMTSGGELYRTLNSAVAADASLPPEARRAGTFGAEDRPLTDAGGAPLSSTAVSAPAYRYAADPGGGGLSAVAERTPRGWRVVFTRQLAGGAARQAFLPGGVYRFGLAVFDGTSVNHHIVRDTKTLQLVIAPAAEHPGGDSEIL